MNYRVVPGLYGVGNPDSQASVLVTANYKMSFDGLRRALAGRSAWILALDTQGINVWCAAGKGTFGTDELVQRIESSNLAQIVSHRTIVLPQLGAPGVAAHLVKQRSGFRVVYGPIQADDLPRFLDSGLKATTEMRRKTFSLRERMTVIPVELVQALKKAPLIVPFIFLLGGLGGAENFWADGLRHALFGTFALLSAIVAGAVVTPLLLPWLPGRAFAVKGLIPAFAAALVVALVGLFVGPLHQSLPAIVAWMMIVIGLTAYLAMNFTGASTYTSLSGVKREMRWAVPFEVTVLAAGAILWLGSLFLA